jgi:hypothetical protein
MVCIVYEVYGEGYGYSTQNVHVLTKTLSKLQRYAHLCSYKEQVGT